MEKSDLTDVARIDYHIDRDNIDADILKHKLRVKLPQRLPRAIDPEDVHQLLSVIKRTRDRALFKGHFNLARLGIYLIIRGGIMSESDRDLENEAEDDHRFAN